ncbi:uncharacterized protein LOC107021505 [Solanum pennellii]|uniref:Uncharacterized protein LOC107021505 n=1 Tax=Solanum pennellii TaxID=28526 RepID=A0ABM1GYB6_SOLPN|nr:uncharacterized protein LOC107021505 [Solanum pennellii]
MAPYEILQRVGKVAYELKVPSELSSIHQVFHFSMLNMCVGYTKTIQPIEDLGIDENLTYKVVPFEISDCQLKRLRNKDLAFRECVMEKPQLREQHGRPRLT